MRRLTARLRALFSRSRPPVIHLYCLCWNEERMLPFFFRHYDPLVDRYFVFDNGSTDRSLEMLAAHPKVTVRHFETPDDIRIAAAPDFYETVWHPSRHTADWVIIVDMDEHLFHPDGRHYFETCLRNDVTVIPSRGFQMVADEFPATDVLLSASIRTGVRDHHMDKVCAFRPDAVERINFAVGRHTANPHGRIVRPQDLDLGQGFTLLHYKYLGARYLIARFAELGARIPAAERARGWGKQYFKDPAETAETHRRLLAMAKPVEGL